MTPAIHNLLLRLHLRQVATLRLRQIITYAYDAPRYTFHTPLADTIKTNNTSTIAAPGRFEQEAIERAEPPAYTYDSCPNNYYCYRYYSTEMGRWMNRDPIGEYGGMNVYICLDNNSVRSVDIIGLSEHICGIDRNGNLIYCDRPPTCYDCPDLEKFPMIPPDWSSPTPRLDPFDPFPPNTDGIGFNTGFGFTFLTTTYEFSFSDGCSFFCISWTPTDLLGAGVGGAAGGNSKSPLCVSYGISRHCSIGTDGYTLVVNAGAGIGFPVHVSVRIECFALTKTNSDGCPCKKLKPPRVMGY